MMRECQCWLRTEPYIKRETRLEHRGGSFILVRLSRYICKRCGWLRSECYPLDNNNPIGSEFNLKSDGTIEDTRRLTLDELWNIRKQR